MKSSSSGALNNEPSLYFCRDMCIGHGEQCVKLSEQGELGDMTQKLFNFLCNSQHYTAVDHVASFPRDGELITHQVQSEPPSFLLIFRPV